MNLSVSCHKKIKIKNSHKGSKQTWYLFTILNIKTVEVKIKLRGGHTNELGVVLCKLLEKRERQPHTQCIHNMYIDCVN